MAHVAGIDPGKTGGYAIYYVNDRELVDAGRLDFDNPDKLYDALEYYAVSEILIERAQGAPGQANQFEYGRSFGRTEAVCMLQPDCEIYYCAAVWWKAKLHVSTDKKIARQQALDKIPGLAPFCKLEGDHGVAEAALIGRILLSETLHAELLVNNQNRLKPKKKRPVYRL
jgi:hypothetical protein